MRKEGFPSKQCQTSSSVTMRQKLDFHLVLLPESIVQSKVGDVLTIREAPQEEGAAPAPSQLACFNAQGETCGSVPLDVVRRLHGHKEAQASVRSVKRNAEGQVQQLLLRVELSETGPVPQGEGHMPMCSLPALHAATALQPPAALLLSPFHAAACLHVDLHPLSPPSAAKPDASALQQGPAAKTDYIINDDGFQLRHSQLEQLGERQVAAIHSCTPK